ncbi:MAG: CRTAC1 family protein [Acidobacteria bacterium]|nr:CRTAC1 family protein [Acidobacteriota bacterium]
MSLRLVFIGALLFCAALSQQTRQQKKPERLRRTYEANKIAEAPTRAGHATAPGPPPPQTTLADDLHDPRLGDISLQFEAVEWNGSRTYFGSPRKDHILEWGGAGVALIDYDGDGLLDIFVVNGAEIAPGGKIIPHRHLLYKNLGDWKFRDVSRRARIDAAGWGAGVCGGDYDGDGRLDLYVTNVGANMLFRNNGDGTFSETARAAGADEKGWSTGCSFFDADGDGHLDLYVAKYMMMSWADVLAPKPTISWRGGPAVMAGPQGLPAAADVLLRNEGNGRFHDSTEWLNLKPGRASHGFDVLTTDADSDGWVDIFVANDSDPNFLFRNRGNGRFEEVALASGVAFNAEGRAQAGMGASAADFDGDGRLDIALTAFAQDTNTLYRNRGRGLFEDASEAAGLKARTFERMGWGAAFLDADLDGLPDLFFANGHIYPQVDEFPQLRESYRQENQLLLNRGGRFLDVSLASGSGLRIRKSHRGVAIGDLDNDGRQDLVIAANGDVPTILRNRSVSAHHWVNLQFVCEPPNAFCIGAAVHVDAGGRRQVQEIRSGGGYVSHSDLRLHFGLGRHTGKIDVSLVLPGGKRFSWREVETGRFVVLRVNRP